MDALKTNILPTKMNLLLFFTLLDIKRSILKGNVGFFSIVFIFVILAFSFFAFNKLILSNIVYL